MRNVLVRINRRAIRKHEYKVKKVIFFSEVFQIIKNMRFISICFFLILSISANAQFEKILHQSFDVTEFDAIKLTLSGEYEIEKWAGNMVLTETKVQLFDASRSIFDYYINTDERYKLETVTASNQIVIKSTKSEMKPIKAKKGDQTIECKEVVKIKIYVPDDFNIANKTQLKRTIETDTETSAAKNKK